MERQYIIKAYSCDVQIGRMVTGVLTLTEAFGHVVELLDCADYDELEVIDCATNTIVYRNPD